MKGRQRGRNGGKPRMHHQGGGGGNRNFDHNAGRMRGNAQQLMDKYLALGRDASAQGDRVMAENYFQHADHYYRVVNARFEGQQQNQQRRFNGQQGYDGPDAQGNYNQGNYGDADRIDIPPAPSAAYMQNQGSIADPGQTQPVSDEQPFQGGDQQPQPQAQHQPREHQPREHQNRHHQPREHQPREHQREQQPRQHQPREQRAESDAEIGLPPSLFGAAAAPAAPAGEQPQEQGGREGGERNFRPRHAGRRRFGNRREGAPAAEPTDAS